MQHSTGPAHSLRELFRHPFLLLFLLCMSAAVLFDPFSGQILTPVFWIFLSAATVAALFLLPGLLRRGILGREKPWRLPAALIGVVAATLLFLLLPDKILLLGTVALFLLMMTGVLLYARGRLTGRRLLLLIFAAGFLVRLIYILYTPVEVRQHDVERFGGGIGHSGYIEYLYQNLHLPDFDPTSVWQFYHPPLHHSIAALWLRALTLFGVSWNAALEQLQILPLFYGGLILIFSYKLFLELGLRGKGLTAAVGVLAFHPTLIIMSGSVNNDQLMVALTFGAILYAVRWYRRPSLRHILPLACFIGGAMMAKLSGGLVAPAVALLFLLKLIQSKGRRGGLIRQFAVFGAVCVPLGLWWPVRNFLLYQVSPGYVPDLGTDSFQYIGYRTVTERLFDFSPAQFKTVFVAWGEPHFDYNPVLGLFKTAMFGEYRFAATGEAFYVFCAALFWIGAALTLLAFGTMVYGLITRRLIADGGLRCFFLALYLTIFVSYVRFCFVFPFTCTMNIRYAVPLILIGTVFLGKLAQRLEEKPPLSAAGALCRGMLALTAVFCGLSGVVYLSLAG